MSETARQPLDEEAVKAAVEALRTMRYAWDDETDLGTPFIRLNRMAEIAIEAYLLAVNIDGSEGVQ